MAPRRGRGDRVGALAALADRWPTLKGEIIWAGPAELQDFLRPIEELHPHAQNPRRGDVQLVATSLTRFGQQKPIILDRDDTTEIVAGNHTYMAARELGWTHVAAIEMWEHADEGVKYLLMDNRTSDNSSYDQAELLALLDRYDGADLEATGFSSAEREQIRADLETERKAAEDFTAGQREEPTPGPATAPAVIVRNVLVSYDDADRFREFSTRLNVLRREWGIVDVSACVAEAVRRETHRLRSET